MVHKSYYRLKDAAQILDTDVESLIDYHITNKCQICVLFARSGIALNFDLKCRRYRDHVEFKSNLPYPLVYGELDRYAILKCFQDGSLMNCPNLYHLTKENKAPDFIELEVSRYSNEKIKNFYPINFKLTDEDLDPRFNYGCYWDWALSTNTQIHSDDLVITHVELSRLQGNPSYEQLQTENELLKLELDKLNNSTTGKQQQREHALRYWVAGKGSDTVKRMKQTDIHEELKPVNGLFQIAESTFNDFWQAQNIIKLDAGKR